MAFKAGVQSGGPGEPGGEWSGYSMVLRLTSINFRVGVPVFSLSPACSLSVPVNLLGRLP